MSVKFDINKSRGNDFVTGEPLPIARFPTIGTVPVSPLDFQFPIDGVDSYLAALHHALDDTSKAVDTCITEAAKALGATPPSALSFTQTTFLPDPANYGLVSWPGIQPESLRKVARENLIPQLVIRSRVTDLRRYSSLSTHMWSPGWKIMMRNAMEEPTAQDLKDIKEAESFIENCSREQAFDNPRERDEHRITAFEAFLCIMADDSFTYDGWAIWTDRDNAGRVRSFTNLPAGMIRLADQVYGYKGDHKLFAALVDEVNNPVAAFTRDQMTWAVRNPRSDPSVIGYGWSEIEIAILTIQAFQSAIQLNNDTFTRNSIPNGMLLMKGDFWQQEQIDALMREWTNMKRGTSKMWGLPVLSVPEDGDIEVLPFMDLKGTDIRYKDHLNLMAGVYCGISQFPIRRLGLFASGGSRDNHPLPDESIEAAGVDDPGLPAVLTFIENTLNNYILQTNWPRLKFTFMAKSPKEDARSYEAKKEARTWAEARAGVDQAPLTKLAPAWLKPMAEIMEMAPDDPGKMGMFASLATVMLKDKLGIKDNGDSVDVPAGAPFPGKKDPAKSQEHGHRAGVRRSSSREEARAAKSLDEQSK